MTQMILSPFSETIAADGSNNLVSSNPTGAGGAPLAPTGFTSVYLSDTSLSLAWTDNATNELNYELDRSPNGTDTWTALADPAANATTATSTGLTVDTQYFYRLRAVNAAGNSSYATANGTTTASTLYTITGTGFGTKTGTPYYDDFESETLGAVTGTVGSLVISNSEGTSITTDAYSGSKSLKNDFSLQRFPKIYKGLSGTNTRSYMSGYIKTTGTSGLVWKLGRLGSDVEYSGTPQAASEYTSAQSSSTPTTFSGTIKNPSITTYSINNTSAVSPTVLLSNTWLFYEVEFYAGTTDNSDAFFYERIDGQATVVWENRPYLTTANSSALPDWFLTIINGHANGTTPTLSILMDSIYIDESRARVVMTDNATYANSTKRAVQPIAAYANTSVTATRKRQGFAVNDTAYLHLFNNNGALVSSGASFLVEADL